MANEPDRDAIFEKTQSLIQEKDLFAATEYLYSIGSEEQIVGAFSILVLDANHKAKSIEQVLHFGQAGIQYCLALASRLDSDDPGKAKNARFAAKRMATNIASFTWSGWNESDLVLTTNQMQQGLKYARYSIRQLTELEPTSGQLSFSLWFLGAQLMSNNEYKEAIEVFEQARAYTLADNKDDDSLGMLDGYIGLSKLLNGDKENGESQFKAALKVLEEKDNEDTRFYIEQLHGARKVFESS
jgi:tetratricopeptide (TPR) repeat protein